jgi:carbamoyltransferase
LAISGSLCPRDELRELDPDFGVAKLLFAEHHQSYVASEFFPSPYEEAVVLTADGLGEWATTSVSTGRGNTLETIREIHFPTLWTWSIPR